MNTIAKAGAGLLVGAAVVVIGAQASSATASSAMSAASPKTASVSLRDNFFTPKTATIRKGGSVLWTWRGKAPHNVKGPGFTSAVKKKGTYRRTFRKAGSFKYVCTIHPGMKGTIKVR